MFKPPAGRLRLPVKPSVEHLKKQAKKKVKEGASPTLADAQHALAKEYGCRDWAELMGVVEVMLRGADQLVSVKARQEALPRAARARDLDEIKRILAAGEFTVHDLDKALAHALWYGNEDSHWPVKQAIADLLIEQGADVDGQYGSAYGPIVFGAGECLKPRGLKYLLGHGADVTFAPVDTKYGRHCPLSMWMSAYVRGSNDLKHQGIELLLARGAQVPAEVSPELLAIHRDDAAGLATLIEADPALVRHRYDTMPYTQLDDETLCHYALENATLLHYACEFGEEQCVRLLLDRGAEVNDRAAHGLTPLHCAARGGSAELVRLLLDRGARQWIADDLRREPRHYAASVIANPNKQAILEVLTAIHFGDDAFRDAVAAIHSGEVEKLRQLLHDHPHLTTARVAGGDAITRGYFTKPTLLHFVACNPHWDERKHMPARILESTAAILDAGAEVDAKTPHAMGGTTLALAASSGPAHEDQLVTPLLELLVSRGADPSEGLAAATLHRLTDTTRTLIRLGARHSPISAAGLGDLESLRRLLQDGPSHDELLRAGWAASMNGQTQAVELLVRHGLDPSARLPRPFEPTMLHEAAFNGHTRTVEMLLKLGADPTIKDTQYHGTPAGWARHAGHLELADRLSVTGS